MDFQNYFQSYDNYFWEWENEIHAADSVFETLSIPEGNTIAYESFVMETLELLSLDGFPPFGSLLLALIATNPTAEDSLIKVFEIIDRSQTVQKAQEYPKSFTNAHNFLKTLTELPPELKTGDKRKQVLQAIFKGCHNRVADYKAQIIMRTYKTNKRLLIECAEKKLFPETNIKRDLHTLAYLHVKYPTTESVLAAITGLPEPLPALNEKIMEQEPTPGPSRSFVDELIHERRTFQIGSLIHRIWGGLNIPLHHSAPSHQPLGGVSDLANKGDFDKLLISEFANDDEVFMTRIANNEALYLKREVPPETDKLVRLLLIDCSLKNWGTPKILAFASALAIATHPKTDIECRIFTLGNGYKEVVAETVIDVIDGLNSLGTKLDTAALLNEILTINTDLKHSEFFLITSEDALSSTDMQRALSENYDKIKYIITVEADGNINFFKVQNRGRKLIQHIYLPLEELWSQKPSPSGKTQQPHATKVRGNTTPDLNYPILLPPPKKSIAVFSLNKDVFYQLTNSGHLFKTQVEIPSDAHHYFRHLKGAELMLQNLSVSQNGKYALDVNEDGNYILAAFYPNKMYVSVLNLNTGEFHKQKIQLKGQAYDYSIFYNNGFYLFNKTIKENFKLIVQNEALHIKHVESLEHLNGFFMEVKERIDIFEKGNVGNDILQNFNPLFVTKKKQLQLGKHCLAFDKRSSNYTRISLVTSRDFVPAIESVYEKKENRFLFPDGSIIQRDKLGMLIFISSDRSIPTFYLPTTLNTELAMATDSCFAGSKDYFKEEPAHMEIISVEEFEKRFLQPFINTILSHGV
ncbi:hypothetical protein [Emticicia sp. 21SJ11W-3]|uniref:hypothetical protein n=1 Tax=Emticicia sp. 21SJ11W-3 TaxID=2916755 RepID=UPI00209CDD76|nr:hypothetical protein [Emticicia sp. 21SJ11W-3]UTA66942.1 hypothetical protein MB380_15170 [Emticicia sp. 21SJ11W-3]